MNIGVNGSCEQYRVVGKWCHRDRTVNYPSSECWHRHGIFPLTFVVFWWRGAVANQCVSEFREPKWCSPFLLKIDQERRDDLNEWKSWNKGERLWQFLRAFANRLEKPMMKKQGEDVPFLSFFVLLKIIILFTVFGISQYDVLTNQVKCFSADELSSPGDTVVSGRKSI